MVMSLLLLCGCKSKETTTVAFRNYTTECMGTEMDGSQLLRVWGTGINRTAAIEQAKKKAVYDAVFVGITAGGGQCDSYPVVNEANARTKYAEYFDVFFSNGGAYTKYVTVTDQKKSSIQRFHGDGTQTMGIIVVVDRSALRKRFISDNIIIK